MKKVVLFFSLVLVSVLGYSQDSNPEALNSLEIAQQVAKMEGHVTLLAEKSLELQRDYNKSVRKELIKELRPYRLISVIVTRVNVDGVEAIRFTYTWYALMKNSFINESVSIPVK